MLQDEDDLCLCVTTKMFSSYVDGYGYGINTHRYVVTNSTYRFSQKCFTKQSVSSESVSTKTIHNKSQ